METSSLLVDMTFEPGDMTAGPYSPVGRIRSAWRGIPMSSLAAVLLAAGLPVPAKATLEVDFVTSRGTITAVMKYSRAPMAVANLITLANGTRNWIDPATGQVRDSHFFTGQSFYRVVKNATVKTIEIGSPSGNGTDGPGFAFPDEFDPSLTHEPYVMSMSNAGPNTNGARFCFTGNVTMSERDGVHTVFGKVLSSSSRAVIDSILAAGDNTTTLTAVQVRRTDQAARDFDELAVPLPLVSAVESPLRVKPGTSVRWLGVQPASSLLRAHQSTNLKDWFPHYRHLIGLDDELPTGNQLIDAADVPKRFYYFSLVSFPAVTGFSGLAKRTLTIESPGAGTLIYHFNSTGTGGTYQNILIPGEAPFFSGAFQVRDEVPATFDPYSFCILIHANGLGGSPFNLIRGGLDVVGAATVTGRNVTSFLSATMKPVFEDSGGLEIDRP